MKALVELQAFGGMLFSEIREMEIGSDDENITIPVQLEHRYLEFAFQSRTLIEWEGRKQWLLIYALRGVA